MDNVASGRHRDKMADLGILTEECDSIDCARIRDAAGFIECSAQHIFATGECAGVIGRVLGQSPPVMNRRLMQLGSRLTEL